MRTNFWTGIATFAFCLLLIGSVLSDRPEDRGFAEFAEIEAKLHRLGCEEALVPPSDLRRGTVKVD